jgi:hypothetical protein
MRFAMQQLPHGSRILFSLACLATLTGILSPTYLHAQSVPTESKGMELSAFAGFVAARPDYYTANNTGVAAGAAFTRFFEHLPVDPSLELRGTYASGSAVTERTVSAGLRISKRFHRYHPYIDFLVGEGSIVYATDPAPFEHEDRGLEYSFGGGLDIDLVHNFQARVDIQQQSWNLGENGTLKPQGGDYTLSPTTLLIGINYVIPFRPHVSYRDLH